MDLHSKVAIKRWVFRSALVTIVAVALLFTTSSCTVRTLIEVHDDASGRAEVTVVLHPVAVRYMSDIATVFGRSDPKAVEPFDVEAIVRAFSTRPGVELESIEAKEGNTLRLKASFEDVRYLLAQPGELLPGTAPGVEGTPGTLGTPAAARRVIAEPLLFVAGEGSYELTLRLTRSNFHRISSLFILPESPLTVLLPYAVEDFLPKEEYLEVLTYALEDYLGPMSIEELVKEAGVYATIKTDGPVTAVSGGDISGGRARFFIPLIDALTLEEDLWLSARWHKGTAR